MILEFLKRYSNLSVLFIILLSGCHQSHQFDYATAKKLEADGWKHSQSILKRIQIPEFQDVDFSVTDFGLFDNGIVDSRPAINQAIEACHHDGGGRVVIPEGQYICNGPIHLLSNVELHLERNAIILFGTNPEDYLPSVRVRWEGTLCYNYSPLIYAYQQKNIAITGQGVLDGQAQGTWSLWRRDNEGKNQEVEKPVLRQAGNDVTPVHTRVFGNGFLDLDGDGEDDGYGDGKNHYLRPSFVQLFECENILIEGVTLQNSPMWNVHPVFSRNITIRNIKVFRGTTNDDGIDVDSCTDVLVEDCKIDTEDDCIAIKAGRDQDAWNRPGTENVIIRNCEFKARWNSFCIGSEMSGGVRNVYVSDCKLYDGFHALNFKCNLDRGGFVENVYIRNLDIDVCDEAMFIFRMDYHGYRGNHYPTRFNDFYISNIHCKSVNLTGIKIVGVEDQHIQRVSLDNIQIDKAETQAIIQHADDILATDVMINDVVWQVQGTD